MTKCLFEAKQVQVISIVFIFLLIFESQEANFTSAPRNTSVNAATKDFTSSITLTWLKPNHINGQVTGYDILCGRTDGLSGNKSNVVGATERRHTIDDLLPYQQYTIYIRACTNHGYGRWTSPVAIQTPEGVPSSVCNIKLYSPSPWSIYVEWEPLDPEERNGVLKGYSILYLRWDPLEYPYKEVKVSSETRNYTITRLEANSDYRLFVIERTSKGFKATDRLLLKASLIKTQEGLPSRSPEIIKVKLVCSTYELNLIWSPLNSTYLNGKLIGYIILLCERQILCNSSRRTKEEKALIPIDECKNYTVKVAAYTSAGPGNFSIAHVTSSCSCGAPRPLYSIRSVLSKKGNSAYLPCDYQGRPEPEITWMRGGKQLYPDIKRVRRVSKQFSNGTWYISYTEKDDQGLYTCVMNNTYGINSTDVSLTVAKDVASVQFQVNLMNLKFHNDLNHRKSIKFRDLQSKMEKTFLNLFKPGVIFLDVWSFRIAVSEVYSSNGSVIANLEVSKAIGDQEVKAVTSSDIKHLLIRELLVKNLTTSDNITIGKITMKVSSSPPKHVKTKEINPTDIELTWEHPYGYNAYAIFGYSMTYRRTGNKEWITGNMLPANQKGGRIEGLQSGTKYDMMVVAHNIYGKGNSVIVTAETTTDNIVVIILGTTIPLVFMVLLTTFCFWWRKQKRQRREILELLEMQEREKEEMERHNSLLITLDSLLFDHEPHIDKRWKELPRDSIEIIGKLGSGAFGEVKKGKLRDGDKTIFCAIKMLKANSTQVDLKDLVNELNIMENVGEHPNIISLVGACSTKGPLWLVLKFAENGSLLNYLHSRRPGKVHDYENTTPPNDHEIPLLQKLKLANGIAQGMSHLAEKKCIHRDLAARNVLLGKQNKPMVSDFGLSRDIYESGEYEKTSGGKLPVKWMAIESLEEYFYTLQSDVWSFGVVLWEIETLGRIPYPGLSGPEVLIKLKDGYRLEKPQKCTNEIYDIMLECWQENPDNRPNFSNLVKAFSNMLENIVESEESTSKRKENYQSYDEVHISPLIDVERNPSENKPEKAENQYIAEENCILNAIRKVYKRKVSPLQENTEIAFDNVKVTPDTPQSQF